MHVHHMRLFPLDSNTSSLAQAARKKKLDDPDKVPPVRSRSEDESSERRKHPNRQNPVLSSDRGRNDEGQEFAAAEQTERDERRAPPVTGAATPIAGLDVLFAGIRNETESLPNEVAKAAEPEPLGETANENPKFDELFSLLRAATER
jgi:hypothetical protein